MAIGGEDYRHRSKPALKDIALEHPVIMWRALFRRASAMRCAIRWSASLLASATGVMSETEAGRLSLKPTVPFGKLNEQFGEVPRRAAKSS